MTTIRSLQELGEILGRGGSSKAPPGDPHSAQARECECIGDIHRVYDAARGITTSRPWHPGILCQRMNRKALFSMGTDWLNIGYYYMSQYFPVDPTQENGLEKRTGFRTSLEVISVELLPSGTNMGHLSNNYCRTCAVETDSRSHGPSRQA